MIDQSTWTLARILDAELPEMAPADKLALLAHFVRVIELVRVGFHMDRAFGLATQTEMWARGPTLPEDL